MDKPSSACMTCKVETKLAASWTLEPRNGVWVDTASTLASHTACCIRWTHIQDFWRYVEKAKSRGRREDKQFFLLSHAVRSSFAVPEVPLAWNCSYSQLLTSYLTTTIIQVFALCTHTRMTVNFEQETQFRWYLRHIAASISIYKQQVNRYLRQPV